jgi:hypothetical protein
MIPGSYSETLLANHTKPIAGIKIHGALISRMRKERKLTWTNYCETSNRRLRSPATDCFDVIIDGVAECGQIIIDLYDSYREMGTHGQIDAATHARGKSKGRITCAGDSPTGMPGSHQQLDEGLHAMLAR